MTDSVKAGGCLCGAVRFTINGSLRDVIYCHCDQCRRTSGHFVAATACSSDSLSFSEKRGITWYASSHLAERGFCNLCGASLFWRTKGRDAVSIMAGSIDMPSGLVESHHIFTDSSGDYYILQDGLPQSGQNEQSAI
ncbi:MAG: GFA family protein [Gammaproteobacteria bacterium]